MRTRHTLTDREFKDAILQYLYEEKGIEVNKTSAALTVEWAPTQAAVVVQYDDDK